MKKYINLIIIIIVSIFGILLSTNSFADELNSDGFKIELNTNSKEIHAGEEFDIEINVLKNDYSICAIQADLDYDKNIFELVMENDENAKVEYDKKNIDFKVSVEDAMLAMNNNMQQFNNTIGKIKFRAKQNIDAGNFKIALCNIKAINNDIDEINIDKVETNIKVTANKNILIYIAIAVVIAIVAIAIIIVLSQKKKNN